MLKFNKTTNTSKEKFKRLENRVENLLTIQIKLMKPMEELVMILKTLKTMSLRPSGSKKKKRLHKGKRTLTMKSSRE